MLVKLSDLPDGFKFGDFYITGQDANDTSRYVFNTYLGKVCIWDKHTVVDVKDIEVQHIKTEQNCLWGDSVLIHVVNLNFFDSEHIYFIEENTGNLIRLPYNEKVVPL